MENILFEYLYRDAGNYKQYWGVIFENAKGLSLQRLEDLIRAELRDGEWFLAEKVGLPLCFFNSPGEETDDDHPWHEFGQLVLPGNGLVLPVDDWRPAHDSRDILDLIGEMRVWNQMGWETDKQPCCICKGAFTDAEWEDRHDPHEPDCQRARFLKGEIKYVDEIGCTCNLVCHDRCCPDCNPPEPCPICGAVGCDLHVEDAKQDEQRWQNEAQDAGFKIASGEKTRNFGENCPICGETPSEACEAHHDQLLKVGGAA